MTFQVYYRKWRPKSFGDLVGQNLVSGTLRQAVQRGRVAHSYLLCGPRGTGKTSTARILVKAINCLSPQDGDPCNTCARCLAVNEGRFMDLIELDAASNRGIDEIRNIRDRVNLSPVEGGYKAYIIDEAHMLTEHASNAFLKTLEEPPAHAVFILCTTEPHKILPTIISRCQRFDFRRISSESIVERLRSICLDEGVDVEGEVLTAIAHAAGGSLRDAENLLEQMVVSYGNQIGIGEVHELLGLDGRAGALEFIRYLLMGNTSEALGALNRAAWDGVDLRQLHRQAVTLLRGVLLLQYRSKELLDLPRETVSDLEDLASKSTVARVTKSLRLLGEVNPKYDASSPLPLELAVVEACMDEPPEEAPKQVPSTDRPAVERTVGGTTTRPEGRQEPATRVPSTSIRRAENGGARLAESRGPSASDSVQIGRPAEAGSPAGPEGVRNEGVYDSAQATKPEVEGPGGSFQETWASLVKTLSRYKGKRFNIGALLRDCKSQHVDGETLVLAFSHRSHLERMQEELADPVGMKTVGEALRKCLGASYELRLTLEDDNGSGSLPPTTQSPLVRAALSMGARIVEERER